MPIPHIDIARFDYCLPEERIARYPLSQRDSSKLLIFNGKEISQSTFKQIKNYLPEGAMLVFNDTKVIRARLKFHKQTGAAIEIFCLEPLEPAEVQMAFAQRETTTWKCIVGNSKKWKEGTLEMQLGERIVLKASRLSTTDNTSAVRFEWNDSSLSFAEIIERAGVMPIPPYLNRETEEIDVTRYQTVYSQHKGSVAAPTAGLHFTENILADLGRSHELVKLTLHVGAGTFKPVQSRDASEHVMHTEHIVVQQLTIERLAQTDRPIVAVGTTSVRTVESLFWLGVKASRGENLAQGVGQWDPYELDGSLTRQEAMAALLSYMQSHGLDEVQSQTQIMIVPGYRFRMISALVTNFHQPHSTLLLLIGALVGERWREIYDYALEHDFRFLSYGDSSILYPAELF